MKTIKTGSMIQYETTCGHKTQNIDVYEHGSRYAIERSNYNADKHAKTCVQCKPEYQNLLYWQGSIRRTSRRRARNQVTLPPLLTPRKNAQ